MKLLIIKLGAKGDVVRTLPLLNGLKEAFPDSEIHWLIKKSNVGIVEGSPEVSKIFTLEEPPIKKYDVLYNFDIDDEATSLAESISADKKLGFFSDGGFVSAFNLGAEYYLNTLFDDETKVNNKKCYQEMMFDVAELPYKKQHHSIYLNPSDVEYAQGFIKDKGINKNKLVGVHLGAGPRWPSKRWHEDNLVEFVKLASERGYEILLFGGPDEVEYTDRIFGLLESQGITIFRNDPKNTDKEFAALVNICKIMVCSDSLSLHVSLAMEKPTIGLFFCTPYGEIETYSLLQVVASPLLYDFFPQKMDCYDEKLVKSISAEDVLDKVVGVLS
jgi:heptosyltransferase-2